MAAEFIFIVIIQVGDGGNQDCKRRHKRGPVFFAHHLARNQENVASQLFEAAAFSRDAPHSASQAREELLFVARPRNFGVGGADGGKCVGIASADGDLVPFSRELRGVLVRAFEYVAVARFDSRKILFKPEEIFELARPGKARKNVIDAEEKSALGEVHQQRHQVVAPLYELRVLALAYVINADMHFGAAGHAASQLHAHKKIGVPSQFFGALDGIVVGQSEEPHAAPAQDVVNFIRIAIAFAAEFARKGGGAST